MGDVVGGGYVVLSAVGWHGLVLPILGGGGGVGDAAHGTKVVRAVLLSKVQALIFILGIGVFLGMHLAILNERLATRIIVGRDGDEVHVNGEKYTLAV